MCTLDFSSLLKNCNTSRVKMKFAISCKCLTDLNDTPYSYIIWIYKHTIWKSASDIEYEENWPGPYQVSRLLNHATRTLDFICFPYKWDTIFIYITCTKEKRNAQSDTDNTLCFEYFNGFLGFVVWLISGHFGGAYQSHYCASDGVFLFFFSICNVSKYCY